MFVVNRKISFLCNICATFTAHYKSWDGRHNLRKGLGCTRPNLRGGNCQSFKPTSLWSSAQVLPSRGLACDLQIFEEKPPCMYSLASL